MCTLQVSPRPLRRIAETEPNGRHACVVCSRTGQYQSGFAVAHPLSDCTVFLPEANSKCRHVYSEVTSNI